MIKIESADLWTELESLFKSSKSVIAAVAYVSDDATISFKEGDVLVVDASNSSIAGGRTSASVLESAYKKGAKIYSCDTLHGKVIVFDHKAYIGSANISINSKDKMDEVGVISDHPVVIAGAIQIIDSLANQSVLVDSKFIARILKIKVERSSKHSSTKPRKVRAGKSRSWLISVRNDADYPGDEGKINEDNEQIETTGNEEPAWFWMKKGSRFYEQAKVGDSVVIIEREKKESKKPEYCYRHFVVKKITSDSVVGTKAYHYAYIENTAINWSRFKIIADKAGISRLGSGLNTVRELSEKQSNVLFELWEA